MRPRASCTVATPYAARESTTSKNSISAPSAAAAFSASSRRCALICSSDFSAKAAEDALRAGLPGMGEHAVWADLNTAAPALTPAR
jgi:hypothetical protein